MNRRVCPACAAKLGQLVEPDCIVCEGAGLLFLGPAALAVCSPLIVAVAITLALESSARTIDRTTTLSDNRTAPLKMTMDKLEHSGLITRNRPAHAFRSAERTAPGIAEAVTGIHPEMMDGRLSTAPAFRYRENDRPNARGLPLLSANGHPSALARITDPAPAGAETRQAVRARDHVELKARILLAAADEALTIKQKRERRK